MKNKIKKAISKHIPLDKSWIIRLGVLDIINGYDDITKFLYKQKILSEDLKALYRVSKDWNSDKPLDAGESATLYRFLKFTSWKLKKEKKFILRRTLKTRQICDNPEIINWPLRKLLTLDSGTSQWASASVLMGNKEIIANPPYKLKLTYEAVSHWKQQRDKGECWTPRYDKTIFRQAIAFLELLKKGKTTFVPKQSEDYCFARVFGLVSPEEGEKKWASLRSHETDRIREMEGAIKKADNGEITDSKDHRVVQAIVMRQKLRKLPVYIKDKNVITKSWPQFWDFLEYCEKNI